MDAPDAHPAPALGIAIWAVGPTETEEQGKDIKEQTMKKEA